MAAELLPNRTRAIGMGAALAVHALVIVLVVLFAPHYARQAAQQAGLVAMPLTAPPPPAPPPPDAVDEGAAAPPSRGPDEAPSPPEPPRPLATPTPAEASIDPGSAQASGAGAAPGAGAGQGGEGSGSGAGGSGSGSGAGVVSPPQRIAGALTNADYRAARPPEGAAGTVRVSFRVRADGRVDRCTVLGSSGYAVFDAATCRLIEQRFRFRPARDASGRAVDWTIRTDYTWTPR
ncbi:MAG TPA: energy transducer TonB [Croceibacterium sp.]|nr:energy transducer TonB [Croceibacterium sp.]